MRPATPRDLDGVVALWIALTELHAALDPHFKLRRGAEREARSLVAAQLRDPDTQIFVQGDDRRLAGLCIVRVDRAPPIHAEVCRGEVTDLFVRDELRRQGLGRALADTAIAWAREQGAERIEVRVAPGNQRGQDFWRASGFAEFMDVLHRRA